MMYDEQSTFGWRRSGHWDSKAEKARLCAFLLWQASDPERLAVLIRDAGYGNGDARLAMSEGFSRESAVALELIVKAVIAKQLEQRRTPPSERVPATHDLPALWQEANLPALPRDDQYRLLLFKSVLMWSGRYVTPRTAKAWAEENAALRVLGNPVDCCSKFLFRKPIICSWEEFDRLYQTAASYLIDMSKFTWADECGHFITRPSCGQCCGNISADD